MPASCTESLEGLFAPRSVAVIGASASHGKLGNAALRLYGGFLETCTP